MTNTCHWRGRSPKRDNEGTADGRRRRPRPTNGAAGSASHSTYNRALHYAASALAGIPEDFLVRAELYGLTEEELDFIINYNIKYRMGREG